MIGKDISAAARRTGAMCSSRPAIAACSAKIVPQLPVDRADAGISSTPTMWWPARTSAFITRCRRCAI